MDTLLLNQTPVKRHNFTEHYHEGELLIVPANEEGPEMNYIYSLDESGSYIWNKMDGHKTIEEIADSICKDYNISYKEALKELMEFVSQIKNLLKEL